MKHCLKLDETLLIKNGLTGIPETQPLNLLRKKPKIVFQKCK